MSLLSLVATGWLVGLIFAAPPGAVNTEALRRGLKGGFRAALGVELGSVVGDAFYLGVAMMGAAAFIQAPGAQVVLGLGGAVGLGYLSYRALTHYQQPVALHAGGRETGQAAFATGLFVSLANPFALAFWLTVGGGLGAALHVHMGQSRLEMATFFLSFIAGVLTWAVSFAALVAKGRRFVTPALFRRVNLVLGLAMAGFGLWLGYRSVMMFYR